MRNAFADALNDLAKKDDRILLLSGDIGNKLFDPFKQHAPHRFFNCGVAEANMIGVAAGLALNGFLPVVYTITPFITTRCFEQIRIDIAYHQAPVILVGTGSGFSYASLGPTHHSLEDIALTRTLPGFRVLAPCDSYELRACLEQALKDPAPTYMRIGKKGEPILESSQKEVTLGTARCLQAGHHVLILGTGTILAEGLLAAKLLEQEGISCEVVSMHTVKPLDIKYLQHASTRFDMLVTIEEHGAVGGLGAAVAEWRTIRGMPCNHLLLGVPDVFLHEVGSQQYARKKYGLDGASIATLIRSKLCVLA